MKTAFTLFLTAPILITGFVAYCDGKDAYSGKVLEIIASSNFRDEEFSIPKKVFEDAGLKVVVASSSKNPSTGILGAKVMPDVLMDEVNINDYDAIVFIGGPGAEEYWDNPTAHKVAQDAVKKNKVLAAICIAPVTLANAGVLSNKKATVWFSEAKALTRKGAHYTGSTVEADGNIITANGPSSAEEFAKAILKAIGR